MSKPLDLTKLRTIHLVPLKAFDSAGRINVAAQLAH